MSRLYGSLKGQARTTATRRGNKSIECHVRGWDTGVEVIGYQNDAGDDVFQINITGGSNNPSGKLIGWVTNGIFTKKEDVIKEG